MAKTHYNARFQLTPMPATNRWRKIYRGTCHYVGVGHCANKTDREGYQVALAEWKTLKDKLDNTPTPDELQLYEAIVHPHEGYQKFDPIKPIGKPDSPKMIEARKAQLQRVIEKVEGKPPKKVDTVGSQIDEFVALKMAKYQLGELSASRVMSVQHHLRHVEEVLGKDTPVSEITEEVVKSYWQSVIGLVKSGQIGKTSASEQWNIFKEWVRSIYQINTPRNLARRDFSITRPAKKVVPWMEAEVQDFLKVAPERLQLWVLLQLNCAMYASDISDLKPSEVDWERGRIKRKRSKTEKLDSTPTIDYPLWSRTFALLKKFGKQTGERVFLNRNGEALVRHGFKETNGKAIKHDSVYDTYKHWCQTKGRKVKPLKALRKTGASFLDSHDTYVHCVEHYLAHAAKTITDRSYRNYSQERFDLAIAWLGEKLGITTPS